MSASVIAGNGHRPVDALDDVVWTPARASWREDAVARIDELDAQAGLLRARTSHDVRVADELLENTRRHLQVARLEAGRRANALRTGSGGSVTRVQSRINAAETNLLRLALDEDLIGLLPSIRAIVRENLAPRDPRRRQLEAIATGEREALSEAERGKVIAAMREASAEGRRKMARVRSFRNVLFVTSALLTLLALGIAVLGAVEPAALPVCFTPEGQVVCATEQTPLAADGDVDRVLAGTVSPWDLALIELIGVVAAAIAAAAALRRIRGTSTPFSLPIALALLRLPTGALTALLGLTLMRGGFVPGLSDLDSSAQILAWAIVFGYAQEVFTHLVDSQAHSVLDDVGATSATAHADDGVASPA
jgi:hypothetical protein